MEHIYVVRANGRIASAAGAFPVEIVVGSVRLRFAGIGGVCTLPEHRGKGGMTTILNHLLDMLSRAECPLVWLTGRRARYHRFGFERAGSALAVRIQSFARPTRPLPWQITQSEPKADVVSRIISLRGKLSFRGLCDDETYRLKLSRAGHEIWEAARSVARAYVVLNRRSGWLVEWGGDVEGVRALARTLADSRGPFSVRISPLRDVYTEMWLELGEDFEGHQDCLTVLNPSKLLKTYRPWFRERWPAGKALRLEVTDAAELSVNLMDGRVARRIPSDAPVLRIKRERLPAFMFGPVDPTLLVDGANDLSWLRQVFPLPFGMPGLWRV